MTWGRIETDAVAWQRTLDINLSGPFYLTQAALEPLKASKGQYRQCRIGGGIHPVYGTSAYGISKAGVIALTKSTSLEWARHSIR